LNALHAGEWELDLHSGAVLRSAQLDRPFGHVGVAAVWTLDTFLRHVHVQDLDNVARSFQAAVSAVHEWRAEFRVLWVEGAAWRLFALMVDTTEQRAADDERAGPTPWNWKTSRCAKPAA
jgi:hypothetical protein